MIRRDVNTQPGKPHWLLINQIQHARISGELAESWGQDPFLSLVCREQLLPAIYDHDDGWQEWEQAPEVDPQTGRPLTFTEMPLAESLVIWSSSIESAASFGPLAAWVVAGHFVSLLGQAEEASQPSAQSWMADCESQRKNWFIEWTDSGSDRTEDRAKLALAQLKLFDWLSLWLCMAERTSPQNFDIPGGPKLTITPLPSQTAEQQQIMQVDPWPLTTDQLTLRVTGRQVPVKHYQSNQELAEIPPAQHTLSWKLIPISK